MSYVGRPRLLSNADLGIARSMKASGACMADIAHRMGVHIRTVRTRLRVPYKQRERRW